MPDLDPLDIGRPDDDIAAIMRAIEAYRDAPVATAEERLDRIRGTRHLRRAAYDSWALTVARGHYDEGPAGVKLIDATEVSGMRAKSTIQRHVAAGLELMSGAERKAAEAVKLSRRGLVRRTRSAA